MAKLNEKLEPRNLQWKHIYKGLAVLMDGDTPLHVVHSLEEAEIITDALVSLYKNKYVVCGITQ